MPRDAACSAVRLDVGIPTMLEIWPAARSSPMRATAKAAVEPVPRPRTMPDLTESTAFSAASFLRSSWVRVRVGVGEDRDLMVVEKGLRWRRSLVAALRWRRVEEEEVEGRREKMAAMMSESEREREMRSEKSVPCLALY